ncbi:MAG TPA: hypothetical protein PKD72_10105, partial [Gemmatales bacterium]|nr:hypothetical protein [Gemmatales bacterium]
LPAKVLAATAALRRDDIVLVHVSYAQLGELLRQLHQSNPDVQVLPITHHRDSKVQVILHETVPALTSVEELQQRVTY